MTAFCFGGRPAGVAVPTRLLRSGGVAAAPALARRPASGLLALPPRPAAGRSSRGGGASAPAEQPAWRWRRRWRRGGGCWLAAGGASGREPWRREARARRWTGRSGRPRSPAPPSSAGSWTAPSRHTCSTRTTSASPSGTRRRRPPCTSWWSRAAPSRASAAWPRATSSSWGTCWWSPAGQRGRRACRTAIAWSSTTASRGHSPSTICTSMCWGGAKWAGRPAEQTCAVQKLLSINVRARTRLWRDLGSAWASFFPLAGLCWHWLTWQTQHWICLVLGWGATRRCQGFDFKWGS